MDVTQQISGFLTPYDYEDITIDNTVKGFTASKIAPADDLGAQMLGHARLIIAVVETAAIRWRVDGKANPVATGPGILANDTQILTFANLQAMKNFRATRETGTSATLRVTYFR